MGFLPFRHTIDWTDLAGFKSFIVKYNKFFKLNMQNLKTCKANALKDNNYDQIENFIEYEEFIANSYFNQLTKFVSYLIEFMEQTSGDQAKNFFTNMKEQLQANNKVISDFGDSSLLNKKART